MPSSPLAPNKSQDFTAWTKLSEHEGALLHQANPKKDVIQWDIVVNTTISGGAYGIVPRYCTRPGGVRSSVALVTVVRNTVTALRPPQITGTGTTFA